MSQTATPARSLSAYERAMQACDEARIRGERNLRAQARLVKMRIAHQRNVFAGAADNRLLEDWFAPKLSPDEALRWNLDKLRRRSRDLEINAPTIRHYLRMVAVNVIGPDGFKFQAQLRDNKGDLVRRLNQNLEDSWAEWGEAPTLSGRQDFVTFQRQLIRSVARDGEVLVRKWRGVNVNRFGYAVEAIDPELLDETYFVARGENQREIRAGVEIDDNGRPVRYHIWNRPDSVLSSIPRRRIPVPADEILHLYDPDRVNASRGTPWIVSVMVPTLMLEKYREASLVAARVGASKMFFMKRDPGAGSPIQSAEVDGTAEVQASGAVPQGSFLFEANPGTGWVLPDGYSLDPWNPNSPSSEFGAFVKDSMRGIATGVGVSYNGLASDLEGVNYSSMRSGVALERDVWRTIQRWWVCVFLRPLYRDWLAWSIAYKAVVLDGRSLSKCFACRFQPRGYPAVDPLKEVQAGVLGIQAGLNSRTKLLAEQGHDVEDVFEDLENENRLAEELGIDISGPKGGSTPIDETDPEDDPNPDDEKDAATAKKKGGRELVGAGAPRNGNGNGHRPRPRY